MSLRILCLVLKVINTYHHYHLGVPNQVPRSPFLPGVRPEDDLKNISAGDKDPKKVDTVGKHSSNAANATGGASPALPAEVITTSEPIEISPNELTPSVTKENVDPPAAKDAQAGSSTAQAGVSTAHDGVSTEKTLVKDAVNEENVDRGDLSESEEEFESVDDEEMDVDEKKLARKRQSKESLAERARKNSKWNDAGKKSTKVFPSRVLPLGSKILKFVNNSAISVTPTQDINELGGSTTSNSLQWTDA